MPTPAPTDPVQLVQHLYAAFGRGDVATLLDGLSKDVDWQHPRRNQIPWGGSFKGPEAVGRFVKSLGTTIDILAFSPAEFIAQGERVIVLGQERMRVKETKKTYEVMWVQAWTIRNGKVVAFREYTDTAGIEEALGA